MSEKETVLSVGIDVGTTTTQVVFSRLTMENSSGLYSVPKISIAGKEVIYRSRPYFTPLYPDRIRIDSDEIKKIVLSEYAAAGVKPSDITTGAVIITGESARKENAEAIVDSLSDIAGEFVVSAAGPDMESVIAGKGSGAYSISLKERCSIINLDIGGGTTNAVLFDRGKTVMTGCLDVGGRTVRTDERGKVIGISPSAQQIADANGIPLFEGMQDVDALRRLCSAMAELLAEMAGILPHSELYEKVRTPDSSDFSFSGKIKYLCFSGGVADGIRYEGNDYFQFGDIGLLLGETIRNDRRLHLIPFASAHATINATVIGAGSYTTTVSGSTISAQSDMLPLKSLIVYKCTEKEQEDLFRGETKAFIKSLKEFISRNGSNVAIAMGGLQDPTYAQVKILANSFLLCAEECLPSGAPLIMIFEHDMAKIFGLCFNAVRSRKLVAIDSIQVQSTDRVDIGRLIVGGLVAPVVVKTLLFGR